MKQVYVIEDATEWLDLWREHIEEYHPDLTVRGFSSPKEALAYGGNPCCVIYDVGCIGLTHQPVFYLSVFNKFRDRFPDIWCYLCSGIPALPRMILQELGPGDPLLMDISEYQHGPHLGFSDHWNKYA